MTNRVTPYEAGWLTFLIRQQLATEGEAREAMNRVAQEAIDELNRRREEKRQRARRRRREE